MASIPSKVVTPITSLNPLVLVTPNVTGQNLSINSSILPIVVNADTNTTRVEILINNTVIALTNFKLVNGFNQFSGSAPILPNSTPTLVQLLGRDYTPASSWNSGSAVAVGYNWIDENGNVQVVTVAGITGSSEPTWNANKGGLTLDGVGTTQATWTNFGPPEVSPTFQFNLIWADGSLALSIAPPSGLRNYKGTTTSRVEWAIPTYSGFIGVRLQISTDETGVTVPYTQYGDLVINVERSENTVITSKTSQQVTGNQTITTTTAVTQPTNYSAVDIADTDVNNAQEFFAVVSTVIQDPVTNIVFESVQNGPITCGFVDLKKVSPTDFLALQRKEDIAARVISGITRLYPNLDLTPRSELRDLWIDPFALEAANMSVREWFSRVAQSISAISQLDDANGDGISDPVTTSPMKQQIARAYGLSATDTQNLINMQFDILGEQAGILRGGATASVVELTFYTYTQPTSLMTIDVGATVATIPDQETPSVQFTVTASASIDPSSAASFYNAAQGWWAVTVPAQCTTAGSVGNVGAGTIRQPVSGIPTGFNVTNEDQAQFGVDIQSNSDYAVLIADRLVTGVDSGTRNGYTVAARETPGVVNAIIVAAGDGEMLRDWDPIRQKHVFGCVDIYVEGTNFSEQNSNLAFEYANTSQEGNFPSYLTATLIDQTNLRFQIVGFSSLTQPLYSMVEFRVQRGANSFYLGCANAQIDNIKGVITLDPNEMAFQLVGDAITQAPVPLLIANAPASNSTAIGTLAGSISSYQFQIYARYQTGISYAPPLQPIIAVSSVVGNGATGVVSPTITSLIHSTDFLLTGGSTEAGDLVAVSPAATSVQTQTLEFVTAGPTTLTIDSGMSVTLDNFGHPLDVVSVRSADLSTLYVRGIDYSIVGTGRYHTYGIELLAGSTMPLNSQFIVAYNKFQLTENATFVSQELDVVNGTLPTSLQQQGFVQNVWLPVSYGQNQLAYDGAVFNPDGTVNLVSSTGLCGAQIPYALRYIKVTQSNGITDVVMLENQDFTLSVSTDGSNTATIARILTGRIADGAILKVSYFVTEEFTVSSQYPAFVEQLTNSIAATKHAAADVLVKNMIANHVDVTMTVTLANGALASAIDNQIRSTVSIALDNAKGKMTQAELIAQVMSVIGVSNVNVPLTKFAKSDGAYDIGIVIPTQTPWIQVSKLPAFNADTWANNVWITSAPVLPDATIPSGGLSNNYVGLLQEGTGYTRASSVADFLAKSAGTAFYIIGTNDMVNATTPIPSNYWGCVMISVPTNVPNPGNFAYRVTYQVFGEGGAKDIVLSSTEYLQSGTITINYVSPASTSTI